MTATSRSGDSTRRGGPIGLFRSASTIQRAQAALILLGIGLLLIGGLVLLTEVPASRYLGIVFWFGGALILHDGIIAPIVFGVSLLMRKAGRAIPARQLVVILAILQGAIVVGAIVFLVVFPEIVKQGIGTPNPTVLPLDYTTHLLVFYAVLVVITGAAIALYAITSARRQKLRPSISQD